MHNKIIEWREKTLADYAHIIDYGSPLAQKDFLLKRFQSLLELLDGEVGEQEKIEHFNANDEYASMRKDLNTTRGGVNKERQRLHTLIHEAQSSLK